MSKKTISSLTPIVYLKDKNGKDVKCAVSESYCIEEQRVLKLDLLEIEILSRLKKIGVNWTDIPLNDEKTFRVFQDGKTSRIFMYSSVGMKNLLKTFHPDSFQDLVVLNAIYRPGCLDYLPELLYNKANPDSTKYPIDSMSEILDETYGTIIYQEQIMAIAKKIANFTPAESDNLRKVLGKRQTEKYTGLKRKFVAGGMNNGHNKSALNDCWEMLVDHPQFAFNKSHAVAYTLISFTCAYCKVHYTSKFNKFFKNYKP